MSLTVLKSHIF